MGPVVIAFTAGTLVLLSGLLINGCRISKLLSNSNTAPGSGGSGGGVIVVVPSLVRDSAIVGAREPRVTNLAVTNGGSWSAIADEDWMDVTPTNGGPRATVRLSLDPRDLSAGVHEGQVTLQEQHDEEARATVSVRFLIQQPVLAVKPRKFDYSARSSSSVFRDTIAITNDGDGPLVWTATTERHSGWLVFESDTTGTAPSALAIKATNEGLSFFGTHKETIVISSPGAKNSPQEIEVTIRRRHGGGNDDDSPTP
jgi:hypothetical protein